MRNTQHLCCFDSAVDSRDGLQLASLLSLDSSSHANSANKSSRRDEYSQLCLLHSTALKSQRVEDYERFALCCNTLLTTAGRWFMPVAYSANHALYMRTRDTPGLEGTCRTISKAFSSCVTDRNDGDQSLKWCVYKLANLLLRAYFRLGATHLCLNIIRTIENASVYELGMYPASDRVTWWYYSGVLKFRQQEYHAAYELLKQAFDHVAGQDMARHRDQILEYLVPLGMLRGLYPPKTLCLGYNKLISAVSRGDLQTYEQQVDRFPRVLLLLEQLRGVLVRNAVVRAHADLQSTRIPLGVLGMDEREAAMLLVNCIDAGLVKGYLSHAGHVLVLSKLQPFPLL